MLFGGIIFLLYLSTHLLLAYRNNIFVYLSCIPRPYQIYVLALFGVYSSGFSYTHNSAVCKQRRFHLLLSSPDVLHLFSGPDGSKEGAQDGVEQMRSLVPGSGSSRQPCTVTGDVPWVGLFSGGRG